MNTNIMAILNQTVSISLFNRGMAGKIFNDVKQSGAKVVMKNNIPECVLLSPEEYSSLIDEVNDARLLNLAVQRMKNYDSSKTVSAKEVQMKLGITDEELNEMDEVEFE